MSKTIIVTGASNGLGAAISRKLVSLGHTVIGVGRCEKRLAKLREGVQSDNFIPIVGDVRDGDTLERTLKQSFDGQVHGLILNAGATRPIGRIANTPIGDFEEALNVSLISPLKWIQALLPALRQSNGRILYTSTGAIKTPMPCWGLFAGPRAGMQQVLASLAKEEPSVTCLSVDPGIVQTAAFREAFESCKKHSPPEQVKWLESVRSNKKILLEPEIPAESFVKLVLSCPKAKSGTLVVWNEPWID